MVVHDADELRTLIRLFKSEHEPTEMMEFWPDDVLALLDRNLELGVLEMTPEQLREIEQRWEKATMGPWVADMRPVATECMECGEYAYEVPGVIRRKSDGCGIVDVQDSEKQNENAAAIASAPTDITLLIAEVRRLRKLRTF